MFDSASDDALIPTGESPPMDPFASPMKSVKGDDIERAMSNVTVMPTMQLTWSGICASPLKSSQAAPKLSIVNDVAESIGIRNGIVAESQKMDRTYILKDCFGIAQPGEVMAMMGSSGAGKTTLMNVLTQRNLDTVSTSGNVRINGVDVDRNTLRKMAAYVQQDDLFIGTMTVEEHLSFTALMRMGRHYSQKERDRRVRMVMSELNLVKCKDALIGNHRCGIKGISGGERKRLAFASEIMTSPPLLFCDEPTSGLDSYMAKQTIQVLKRLATIKNMTIIVTIHQPSSSIFALFDRIYFLAEGRTAFNGTIREAVEFWKQIGDPVPEKYNPADHFISSLAIKQGEAQANRQWANKVCDKFLVSDVGRYANEVAYGSSSDSDDLADCVWKNNKRLKEKAMQQYKATWCQQFNGLFRRSLLGNLRNPVVLQVRIFQTICIAILISMVYYGTEVSQKTVMNINGDLFQVVVNMNFMFQFTTVHMFCDELPTFLREHQGNLYRVTPYFLAKNLAEAIQYVVYPTIFASIVYWFCGFVQDFVAFLIFTLVCILITKVGISISYMFSCICGNVNVAVAVMPVIVVPLMAFGGFYINVDTLPWYFAPLRYLSYFAFGYEALAVNEWSRRPYIPGCDNRNKTSCYRNGADVLDELSFKEDRLWINIGILCLMIVVVRLIAFAALWTRAKTKR